MNKQILFLIVAILACAAPLFAHHSFAAEFDGAKKVQMTGVVTKVEWMNPHVWFYMDVKDDTGKIVNWGAEMGSPNSLMRAGWTRSMLKVGLNVVVDGSLAKDGSNRVNASSVSVDGKKLGAASSEGEK